MTISRSWPFFKEIIYKQFYPRNNHVISNEPKTRFYLFFLLFTYFFFFRLSFGGEGRERLFFYGSRVRGYRITGIRLNTI